MEKPKLKKKRLRKFKRILLSPYTAIGVAVAGLAVAIVKK